MSWVVLSDPEGNEVCVLRALTDEEMGEPEPILIEIDGSAWQKRRAASKPMHPSTGAVTTVLVRLPILTRERSVLDCATERACPCRHQLDRAPGLAASKTHEIHGTWSVGS